MGVLFGSRLLLAVFPFAVYQLTERLLLQTWSQQCVGSLHAVPLALSPSPAITSPCMVAVASLNGKDFCLKDLQFLLAVTGTLVGHGCYTLSFCHQVYY